MKPLKRLASIPLMLLGMIVTIIELVLFSWSVYFIYWVFTGTYLLNVKPELGTPIINKGFNYLML